MNGKPSVRTVDYIAFVQSGVMQLSDVPTDIRDEVANWMSFLIKGTKKGEGDEPNNQAN